MKGVQRFDALELILRKRRMALRLCGSSRETASMRDELALEVEALEKSLELVRASMYAEGAMGRAVITGERIYDREANEAIDRQADAVIAFAGVEMGDWKGLLAQVEAIR